MKFHSVSSRGAVASLGLVSPGATTDGVTLKMTTFLVISLCKVKTFLAVVY